MNNAYIVSINAIESLIELNQKGRGSRTLSIRNPTNYKTIFRMHHLLILVAQWLMGGGPIKTTYSTLSTKCPFRNIVTDVDSNLMWIPTFASNHLTLISSTKPVPFVNVCFRCQSEHFLLACLYMNLISWSWRQILCNQISCIFLAFYQKAKYNSQTLTSQFPS